VLLLERSLVRAERDELPFRGRVTGREWRLRWVLGETESVRVDIERLI